MTGVILNSASQNPYTNTGVISGYGYGILADNLPGVTWSITNGFTGSITTTGTYGVGVVSPNGEVLNEGYINSSGLKGTGVSMGSGLMFNYGGYIAGGFEGYGVTMGTGSVDNVGYIYGGRFGVSFAGSGTVANVGEIVGGKGVVLAGGGKIVNGYAGANFLNKYIYITGYTGVEVHDHAGVSTIDNYGYIGGRRVGAGVTAGIVADGNVDITNGGPQNHYAGVLGYGEAGLIGYGGSTTLFNYGVVSSDTASAISIAEGFVDNIKHGDIFGGHGGVYLGTGSLTNEGTINGGSAVGVGMVTGQIINRGGIFGNVDGLYHSGSGLVENYGTIVGGSQSNSTFFDGARIGDASTLVNKGLIQGPTGVHLSSATLDNFGRINAVEGGAVICYGDDNRVILHAAGQVNGTILAPLAYSNILELASTGHGLSGTIANLGTTIAGFQSLEVDAGGVWTLAGASSTNSQAIDVGRGAALTLTGSLYNIGPFILGGLGAGRPGALVVDGALNAGYLLTLQEGATLSVTNAGTVLIGAGPAGRSGRVTVDKGATVTGTGTLAAGVMVRGLVDADDGTLAITGAVTGSGSLAIDPGGALVVNGRLRAASVSFGAGGQESLTLGDPAGCTATLSGFAKRDSIDLVGVSATGASFAGGVLTLTDEGGMTLATLKFGGVYQSSNFDLAPDGRGGTRITWAAAPASPAPGPVPAAFAGAMAGMGASRGGPCLAPREFRGDDAPSLCLPRA